MIGKETVLLTLGEEIVIVDNPGESAEISPVSSLIPANQKGLEDNSKDCTLVDWESRTGVRPRSARETVEPKGILRTGLLTYNPVFGID